MTSPGRRLTQKVGDHDEDKHRRVHRYPRPVSDQNPGVLWGL